MGQRKEQRVAVSFQVTVRGLDLHGNPFETTVGTHDISCSGACLTSVGKFVQPGSRIEIQFKDQSAWYRVQWVDANTSGSGRAGVRCLEPGTYIWGVPPKEWVPDTYDPEHPEITIPEPVEVAPTPVAARPWSGTDRRQFLRRSCRIEAQVSTDNGSVRLPATATDISLGGCYLEMLAPLPVGTAVELQLKPEGTTLDMSGQVRSSQTGLGMGIAFTGMRPADFEKLQRLAPATTKPTTVQRAPEAKSAVQRAAIAPTNPTSPRVQTRLAVNQPPEAGDIPATPETFQAVVRLLLRKGLLTRAELMEEFEKLKPTRA